MPPIQQQQTSRAGLITALVISIMFALGFLVWAIMNNAEITKIKQSTTSQLAKYKEVIDEAQLPIGADPDVEYLRKERQGSATLITTAIRQLKDAVKIVSGSEGKLAEAKTAADTAYAAVAGKAALKDTKVPTDSLANAVSTLASKVEADAGAVAAAKAEAIARAQELAAEKQRHADEITKRDAAVKAEQDKATQSAKSAETAIGEKQKQVDDFAKQVGDAQKALADAQTAMQAEITGLKGELEKLKKTNSDLVIKIAMFRPNVKNANITNIDARITQLAADNTCYIDLGFGDHIVPGITFEVYDKLVGMPKLPNAPTTNIDLPKGKATIEIIEVGQVSSRCRIQSVRPGQQVSQGDLCANLIYDKFVKPTFYVYGDFDFDQNGIATAGEGENIKNLIIRWGGKVADKLTIDVDYVIMGKEPAIPSFTPEELQVPSNAQKAKDAKDKLDAFNNTLLLTADLHIPVMNQNRFLYYVGYFDMARK